jgi:hypothetical protein
MKQESVNPVTDKVRAQGVPLRDAADLDVVDVLLALRPGSKNVLAYPELTLLLTERRGFLTCESHQRTEASRMTSLRACR